MDCYKVSVDKSLVDAACIPDVGNNDFKTVKDAVAEDVEHEALTIVVMKKLRGSLRIAKRMEVAQSVPTLVYYKVRAPNGQESDWIMHEYRLERDENATSTHIPTRRRMGGITVILDQVGGFADGVVVKEAG
ncbi:NAC domain-containing protein 7-like protein [Tanacetum coccineum]